MENPMKYTKTLYIYLLFSILGATSLSYAADTDSKSDAATEEDQAQSIISTLRNEDLKNIYDAKARIEGIKDLQTKFRTQRDAVKTKDIWGKTLIERSERGTNSIRIALALSNMAKDIGPLSMASTEVTVANFEQESAAAILYYEKKIQRLLPKISEDIRRLIDNDNITKHVMKKIRCSDI